ncbi:MAG TPA: TetR/AcrR family transcriptional regulator [Burkholderiaceae bacterium]|nr:TetR/AcrR family transcriptional regulator [Burkholderiaceae bacterium]
MSTTSDHLTSRPRWERRKDARPAELLAAALELFIEKGYAGTRLEDVASRAGVSKGTLYLYFENKEELFKAVVRDNVVARISASAEELASFAGSGTMLLTSLITRWWSDYGSSEAGGLGKLIMAESGNFPEIARFFLDEVIEPWHALLAGALRRGIDSGEFRPVDVQMFVRVITAPLVMLSLWKRSFGPCSAQPIDADAYIRTHVDMVLAALRPA